jgi:hypothetical protein
MTVEMGIRRHTGEYEVVPVATAATFREVWLPACERLGLEWVARLHDGALTPVPLGLLPQIVNELGQLRGWAAEQPDLKHVVERIDAILAAFRDTDPLACEYDFG